MRMVLLMALTVLARQSARALSLSLSLFRPADATVLMVLTVQTGAAV
jgi:hypothetical protein